MDKHLLKTDSEIAKFLIVSSKSENMKKEVKKNGFLLQVSKGCLQLTKSCFCSVGVKFYNNCPWNNIRLNVQKTSGIW